MALILWIGGVLAAMLPARYWPSLDRHVPASRAALLSSLLTVLGAGIFGVAGFIAHAQEQAGAVNDALLTSPRVASAGDDVSTLMLQGASAVSILTFFLTPVGIAAAYLTLSGAARAVSATFAEGSGDLLLTATDWTARRLGHRMVAGRDRRTREAREGPPAADQIFRGKHLGIDADLVVVSARRKPDWDQGTIVHAGEQWYRVGPIEERTLHGYLRTLYPLREVKDHQVFRRTVEYDIPARYGRDADGP